MEKIVEYLLAAAGKDRSKVDPCNPFRNIGFDDGKERLGWVNAPSWDKVKQALSACLNIIGKRKEFVFIGMGGSINGAKTVVSLSGKTNIHCLDSLDPAAFDNVVAGLASLKKTVIIPISKSGTTKETQLLAGLFKTALGSDARSCFLWLTDPDSFSKLDAQGWSKFPRLPIQVDKKNDIGGRFSSPHTLIFLLPLLLILDKRLNRLKEIYGQYCVIRGKMVKTALADAGENRSYSRAYFSVFAPAWGTDGLRTWATQLFQESLGSKKRNLAVKTLVVNRNKKDDLFHLLAFRAKTGSPLVKLMSIMAYLQYFVAFYAYFRKINFVNQPSVEKYKDTMRNLSLNELKKIESIGEKGLIARLKTKVKANHKFIEIVLYF